MVYNHFLNLLCLLSSVKILVVLFTLSASPAVLAAFDFNMEDFDVSRQESVPLRTKKKNSRKKGFWEQRYRGWLWFEETLQEDKKKLPKIQDQITPEEARRETEELKKRLDDFRDVMIARPTPENVRNYIAVEDRMWARALALDEAQRKAKLLYPQYFDKLKNPENVHAVKFNRKLKQEQLEAKVKDFATKYDLVFFANGNCPHCREFAPILKSFSDNYGFKTEEASIDGNLTGFFDGKKLPELAAKLRIEATPTVVIVSKDGTIAMELIRGYVTTSELEEYVGLANQYLKERQMQGVDNLNREGR